MSRGPHIAFVITRCVPLGGSQVHVHDLSAALSQGGYRVTVLVGGEGAYLERLRAAGVDAIRVPSLARALHPGRDLRALRELRRQLQRLAPDLISLHTAKAGALGRLAAVGLQQPLLYTPHGWSFSDPSEPRAPLYGFLERLLAPLANLMINVCDNDCQQALARGVGRQAQHRVIHNGMPDIPASLRADPSLNPPRLVMVARFEAAKDHPTLLRALQLLPRELPWSLELIGSGERLPAVQREVAALGLASQVTFLGARDDVAVRLAQAQLLVLTSHAEGFPRSILEALRAGLPVLATRVNGIPEALTDGVEGLLVPPRDPQATAAALAQLLRNPHQRVALGAAGRARYERAFTFERMLGKYLSLYQSLLPRSAPAPSSSVTSTGSHGPQPAGSAPESEKL